MLYVAAFECFGPFIGTVAFGSVMGAMLSVGGLPLAYATNAGAAAATGLLVAVLSHFATTPKRFYAASAAAGAAAVVLLESSSDPNTASVRPHGVGWTLTFACVGAVASVACAHIMRRWRAHLQSLPHPDRDGERPCADPG